MRDRLGVNATLSTESLRAGAAAYGGVLAGAGGRELEAPRQRDAKAALAVASYASPPYDVQVPAIAVSRLSINLTDSAVSGGLGGERARTHETRRGSLFVTPAGAAAAWRKARPSRHLNVYFDADVLRDREDLRFDAAPVFNLVLPAARPLIEQLAAELATPEPFAVEAADSLARLILVLIARRRLTHDTIAPALLARVAEFVQAHLDARLLVGDLAAAAGLPPARFATAFARTTGRTPHQYVIERRVEQAAALLRRTRQPLAEVAATCGFASQQHMTQHLRRRLGATPARLRDAALQ